MSKSTKSTEPTEVYSIDIEMVDEYNPISKDEPQYAVSQPLLKNHDLKSALRRANCNARQSQDDESKKWQIASDHANYIESKTHHRLQIQNSDSCFVDTQIHTQTRTPAPSPTGDGDIWAPPYTSSVSGEYEIRDYETQDYNTQDYKSVYEK